MKMRRSLIVVLAIAVLLVAGFIYYALDPASSSAFPSCTFLKLTGYKCPGCGSQRAIHALLHGDVAGAFRYNALLIIAIPWIALCLYAERWRVRKPRLYERVNAPLLIWLFLAMVLLWWLLRNIFNW
ncbi:MAG: DUF2752 domain-containing protein [Muribaculaceae bacterium]|nr:DUF2752 domain-containing protein [Muribaculaceae bacterium]